MPTRVVSSHRSPGVCSPTGNCVPRATDCELSAALRQLRGAPHALPHKRLCQRALRRPPRAILQLHHSAANHHHHRRRRPSRAPALVRAHARAHTHMHTCACARARAQPRVRAHTSVRSRAHAHVCARARVCVPAHTCVCTCVCPSPRAHITARAISRRLVIVVPVYGARPLTPPHAGVAGIAACVQLGVCGHARTLIQLFVVCRAPPRTLNI